MFYNGFNGRKNRNDHGLKIYDMDCRYCGRDVTYYEKEHESGLISKVFFEDLGGPWPKHSCEVFLNTDRVGVYVCGAKIKNLYWVKRGYDKWYQLDRMSANIRSLRHKGVYIIWYFDVLGTARTVKVGSGQLEECLEVERRDPDVQRYADRGPLHVTWVLVGSTYRDGVEDSLNQKLQPFVGQRDIDEIGIFVGLPKKLKWTY